MTANILMLKIVKTNIKAVEFSTAFLCIMNRKDKSDGLLASHKLTKLICSDNESER